MKYNCSLIYGGLAQLARACDWQSQGREFDSPNLHSYNQTVINESCGCLFYLNLPELIITNMQG